MTHAQQYPAAAQGDVVTEKGNYTADIKHIDSLEDARDTDSEIQDKNVRIMTDIDEGFDPKQLKRIVRKIDLHVIPILALMYCISLIDRTNLSMARSANEKAMNKELGLDIGSRYSIATMSELPLPASVAVPELTTSLLHSLHHP